MSAWYEARRPRRILDGYSGAGGAAHGYAEAGCEVTGVDSNPRLRDDYLRSGAAEFICADVLEVLADKSITDGFDLIHASPPCQAHSAAKNIRQGYTRHPDLIAPTRDRLIACGKPYVIENVVGAPLIQPFMLCGLAFELNVKRHRVFETSLELPSPPPCPPGHPGNWVTVFGGGAPAVPDNRRRASASIARAAMGIDWMSKRDYVAQAIPPAYTYWIATQWQLAGAASRLPGPARTSTPGPWSSPPPARRAG